MVHSPVEQKNKTEAQDGQAPAYDEFISYASQNRPEATRIQRFLEKAFKAAGMTNAKIYLDATDIRGGSLADELTHALLRSQALIVCCSPAAKDSRWVDREINVFIRAN